MIGAITLDQLRILVTVDETGSFSAAGRKLRRVQSAVSHAIQTLETAHGVELFDRTSRTPRLTEAGRVLVNQARQVLRQTELFERTAKAISAGLEPQLGFAIDSMVPTEPITRSLKGLQTEFPDLTVSLFTEGPWSTEQRLRDGTVTLAIGTITPVTAQSLRAYPLTSIQLVPVVAPDHPLAQVDGPVTRDQLSQHVQLILTDPTQSGGQSFGVVSPKVWRFIDIARRLEFILAGFGWGNMPSHLVERYLIDGGLKQLAVDDPSVTPTALAIYAIHRRDNPPGIATTWLLNNLLEQNWR
ncbi:LysR family transcriptional regulator (plasmid) [Rhizobium sp. CB3171]|uniref:LysR family transcriptional regulator n=1 Tax=Rhizobium sp. CB3171 TaxID=3039157 RepID=UPI0024B246A2|nr:LysR family transcriptional regulator [Rhizobium sp. CB3171]WFU07235.1 LysR family transcriptional regulator [Rhizobium sp. CB3171]